MSPHVPLSVLDLAPVDRRAAPGRGARETLAASVELARAAERSGYRRVWYAEHHSMPSIASSAPAVLVAHVAAHTSTIRLGAGGVMLPNHAPLTIAEQFGTLAAAHPGRIDLGLGRAPGSDGATSAALRRDPSAADTFPDDVLELQDLLAGTPRRDGVQAVPHALDDDGLPVPLFVLGSSLFGARLAAALGLPYAFASHFAPDALEQAMDLYRREFTPNGGPGALEAPHAIAAVNVFAADDEATAAAHVLAARRQRAVGLFGRGRLPEGTESADDATFDAAADALLDAGASVHVDRMTRLAAVGTPDDVVAQLDAFAARVGADELITAHGAPTPAGRVRSVELVGSAVSAALAA
ncbi:LLM class flavin-dependent oxidoreductase [Streptomyces sp. NP160]|uniref:LLM class flavin-dependent oxidoreductase n=1 Tax=Streptomyces sp. NP160 TaxID=2586637 RepID=UPI0011181645|nr:LLM class flavin-dependent oxidoreductase [Streptomyces sp. NP160]TNM59694.1 LLM class flavin-dependent oxidoreductase [Streptomyces sp. NP160]